ncbi:MAG: HAD-IIB family hydrolase [Pseudomonadota bacterium]
MNKVYLFDVDGTLTPPRMPVDSGFAGFFYQFVMSHNVYLISGSDYGKLREQLPDYILEACNGVYGCSGAQFHQKGKEVYRKDHEFSNMIQAMCEIFIDTSPYSTRTGVHIEKRPGMLNVSVVGRNATPAQRKAYYVWDQITGERRNFVDMINNGSVQYEASAGGEISIDIVPKGWNKSVVMTEVLAKHRNANLVFFGDRICEGGNDKPLADALEMSGDGHVAVSVETYTDTWRALETNYYQHCFEAA